MNVGFTEHVRSLIRTYQPFACLSSAPHAFWPARPFQATAPGTWAGRCSVVGTEATASAPSAGRIIPVASCRHRGRMPTASARRRANGTGSRGRLCRPGAPEPRVRALDGPAAERVPQRGHGTVRLRARSFGRVHPGPARAGAARRRRGLIARFVQAPGRAGRESSVLLVPVNRLAGRAPLTGTRRRIKAACRVAN